MRDTTRRDRVVDDATGSRAEEWNGRQRRGEGRDLLPVNSLLVSTLDLHKVCYLGIGLDSVTFLEQLVEFLQRVKA